MERYKVRQPALRSRVLHPLRYGVSIVREGGERVAGETLGPQTTVVFFAGRGVADLRTGWIYTTITPCAKAQRLSSEKLRKVAC